MGAMQRQKGKRYERAIAAVFRERWPDAIVRRASQAERADNPDVFIEGGPPVLARLWLELTDGRAPNPIAKLEQAVRDVNAFYCRRGIGPALVDDPRLRLPVVIWHRLGERQSYATCALWVLDALRGLGGVADEIVTLSLPHFLARLKASEVLLRAREAERAA